jgi:hypothetical protein
MTRKPNIQQLDAVLSAIHKFTGQGRWAGHVRRWLPELSLRWDGDAKLSSNANAQCEVRADGSCVITLRASAHPSDLHRSMLHELAHAEDAPLIRCGMPRHVVESRAEHLVGMLEHL